MATSKRKHRHGIYRFYAPFYDRVFAPSFSDGHSKLYSSLVLEKNDHILEVGIGTGISLTHCPEFVRVDAIDYSEAMLVKARKRFQKGEISAQVEFTKMDAHSLEFEDNAFEHSIVAHALAVVAEPKVVLDEMIRVTKRGGKIVIVNHYKKNGGPSSRCSIHSENVSVLECMLSLSNSLKNAVLMYSKKCGLIGVLQAFSFVKYLSTDSLNLLCIGK